MIRQVEFTYPKRSHLNVYRNVFFALVMYICNNVSDVAGVLYSPYNHRENMRLVPNLHCEGGSARRASEVAFK